MAVGTEYLLCPPLESYPALTEQLLPLLSLNNFNLITSVIDSLKVNYNGYFDTIDYFRERITCLCHSICW